MLISKELTQDIPSTIEEAQGIVKKNAEDTSKLFEAIMREKDNQYPTYCTHGIDEVYNRATQLGQSLYSLPVGFFLLEEMFSMFLDEWQQKILAACLLGEVENPKDADTKTFDEVVDVPEKWSMKNEAETVSTIFPNIPIRRGVALYGKQLDENKSPATIKEVIEYLEEVKKLEIKNPDDISHRIKEINKSLEEKIKTLQTRELQFSQCSLIVPRRNGKSYLIAALIILHMIAGKTVVYTSLGSQSAQELTNLIAEIVRGSKLSAAFKVHGANTNYKATFIAPNGKKSRLIVASRSSGSLRGFGADIAILDEANSLSRSELSAVSALIGNSLTPQMILVGTPSIVGAGSGGADGVFAEIVEEVKKNKDDKSFHAEWSTPKQVTYDEAKNPRVLARFNPAVSIDQTTGKFLKTSRIKINSFNIGEIRAFNVERLGFGGARGNDKIEGALFSRELLEKYSISTQKLNEVADSLPRYTLGVSSDDTGTLAISLVACSEFMEAPYYVDNLYIGNFRAQGFEEEVTELLEQMGKQSRCTLIMGDTKGLGILEPVLMSLGLKPQETKLRKSKSRKTKIRTMQARNESNARDNLAVSFNAGKIRIPKVETVKYMLFSLEKNGSRYDSTLGWAATVGTSMALALAGLLSS